MIQINFAQAKSRIKASEAKLTNTYENEDGTIEYEWRSERHNLKIVAITWRGIAKTAVWMAGRIETTKVTLPY